MSSATIAAPASRTRSSVAAASAVWTRTGMAVDAATALVAEEDSLENEVEYLARIVTLEPLVGETDRRLDEIAPLPRREAAVDRLEPDEKPRNGDGALLRHGTPASRSRRSR